MGKTDDELSHAGNLQFYSETADTNHNTALFLPSESRFLKVPVITGSNKLFNSRSISLQWLQVPLFSLDVSYKFINRKITFSPG